MPATTEKPAPSTAWADEAEEEEYTGPIETIDENGIKTITDYKTNEKGQKITAVKKIRVYTRTVRRNKNVEARKKWKKFGECDGAPPGTEFGITSTSLEEIDLALVGVQKTDDAKQESSVPMNAVCRTCGKIGDHWTPKCPFRQAGDKADSADTEEAPKKGNVYVPPSMRAGANPLASSGGSSSGRRDEFATVRVTNLSEDTKEADLQELFRPFGPISRIYLAKDKESNTSRGFAFVSFIRKEDAARAIEKLSGYGYDHLILHLEWAKPSKS